MPPKKIPQTDKRIKKFTVYVGYDQAGQDRLSKLKARFPKTLSEAVLNALKLQYPDLGL